MIERVERTLTAYDMLKGCAAVTVAVSGGADSTALLHCLRTLSGRYGFSLYAAHFNHALRGEESERDAAFVRQLCGAWNVPLFLERADVRAQAAQNRENLEQCARRLRYAFFKRAAVGKIATAHTADDQLETMLLRLIRGAGLKGLCGIPPVRGDIIRPLLFCTRNDVEAYCAHHGLCYVNDSTNDDLSLARNRLRHIVTPQLAALNPSVARLAAQTAQTLREDEACLSRAAQDAYGAARRDGGLDAAAVRSLPAAVQKRVLRRFYEEQTGCCASARQIEAITGLLASEQGGTSVARRMTARVYQGLLTIRRPHAAEPFCLQLPLEDGAHTLRDGRLETKRLDRKTFLEAAKINSLLLKNAIDCDTIMGKSVLRGRQPGDRFQQAGRGAGKTLKKLFNEAKLPPERRGALPVLADDAGICWVAGFGAAQRCAVTEQTKTVLTLKYQKDDGGRGLS